MVASTAAQAANIAAAEFNKILQYFLSFYSYPLDIFLTLLFNRGYLGTIENGTKALIMKMLSPVPSARPTIAQVLNDLNSVQSSL